LLKRISRVWVRVNENGKKDSFRVSGTTRFQSVLSGTVPGRIFHKVPLGEKAMAATEIDGNHNTDANLAEIRKKIAKYKGCISAVGTTCLSGNNLECDNHTVGLKPDGTVISVGGSKEGQRVRERYINNCKGIVAIDQTIGLKADGTVVSFSTAIGWNNYDFKDWRDIVAVSTSNETTFGLTSKGSIFAYGENKYGQCNIQNWDQLDIVSISAGVEHTVGLRSDGTVVAIGKNLSGQCNVQSWRDIVEISVSNSHTVGLRSDGTVVAVGDNRDGECNTESWRDIVAISAGWTTHTVGLKSDGTVVAVGCNKHGQCNTESWRDIVAISTGGSYTIGMIGGHTVGLKSDGTVVAVGDNRDGECNIENWRGIGPIPDDLIAKFKQSLSWQKLGLCQHCGGSFGGIFFKKCKSCGESSSGGSSGCYVATCVYGSYDCPEVWTLRRFRDNILSDSWFGRRFINIYYTISPKVVNLFGNKKWFNGLWKPILDKFVRKLQNKGIDGSPYSGM